MSILGKLTRKLVAPFRPALVIPAHRLQCEGSEGADIVSFQEILLAKTRWFRILPPVVVTGIYDTQTRTVVRCFQRRALSIANGDGFVGPVTARKLHIRLVGESESRL